MEMVRKVVAEFKISLFFLAPREESQHLLAEDIEKIGERVDAELARRIRQTAFAILRKRPECGYVARVTKPPHSGRAFGDARDRRSAPRGPFERAAAPPSEQAKSSAHHSRKTDHDGVPADLGPGQTHPPRFRRPSSGVRHRGKSDLLFELESRAQISKEYELIHQSFSKL